MAHKLSAFLAALLLGGCVGAGEKTEPAKPVKGERSFEVEDFKLTKAQIEPFKGAGGGKVVVLKKGAYELIVYGYAPSFDEDGFFVHVGDKLDQRMVIPDIKKLLPTKPLPFNATKDGPCEVTIALGEEHVKFDRVVIRPVKK